MSRYLDADKIKEFPIRANNCDKENANKHFIYGIETVMEYIDNIPTADVKPVVRGEWIGTDYDKCSVCGGYELGHTNFCPHCGADMRGKQE